MLKAKGTISYLQNAKFDLQIFNRLNVAVTPIDDTMLMSYALDAGNHGHGMDALISDCLNFNFYLGQLTKRLSKANMHACITNKHLSALARPLFTST